MAPRVRKHLSDIEIDEISLVDRGANQHAAVTIAKRAPEEENMPELFDEEGNLLGDDHELHEGDVVYDGDGQAYEFVLEDEESDEGGENEPEEERELEPAVSKAFQSKTQRSPVEKSFRDEVLEELSKAYTDEERDQVIAKAFDQMEAYSQQVEQAERIAKSERDLRLTREYVSKAAEYNVPIDPNDLGPVLYRMAETMSYDDCATIHKALESAGAALFDEIGHIGGGDNNDIMSQVQAYVNDNVSKSEDYNEADSISKAFDMNPEAYDQYLAEQRGF